MSENAILIPAAGTSSRMKGKDKLLEPVYGAPLLRRVAKRACATGAMVVVTVADMASARVDALKGVDVTFVAVRDAEAGMSSSFRAAIEILPNTVHSLLVVLPDMPDITGEDMALMLNAFSAFPDKPILRAATPNGEAGHPVLLPEWCFKEVSNLEGDKGASPILKKHASRIALLPFQDDRAICDLDTPQAWAKWRAKNPDAQF